MPLSRRQQVEKAIQDLDELQHYSTPVDLQQHYEQQLGRVLAEAYKSGDLVWKETHANPNQ